MKEEVMMTCVCCPLLVSSRNWFGWKIEAGRVISIEFPVALKVSVSNSIDSLPAECMNFDVFKISKFKYKQF